MSQEQTANHTEKSAADLRQQAEETWRRRDLNPDQQTTPDQAQRLVHELQVHQIELEMQNEELQRVRQELEAARDKYFDLYDLAPLGYLTLDDQGRIESANLTLAKLLGVERANLVNRPLTRFITPEDQKIFYHLRRRLDETGVQQGCDLRLVRQGDAPLWVNIETVVKPHAAGGPPSYWVTVTDISAHKQAETALRESEEKWRGLFELLPVGISIVDAEHHVTDINAALTQILELSKDALLKGEYARRRYLRSDHSLMPPEEFPTIRALKEQTLVRNVEIGVGKEDGTVIWTSVSAAPLSSGTNIATVTVDITERKRTEEARQASEARLTAIIENTDSRIWSIDRDYRLLVANSVFQRGIQAQIGRPLTLGESVLVESFPPDANAFWKANYDRALAGEIFTLEMESKILRPDGVFECFFHPIRDAGGGVTGVVCLSRDISERKRAEAQVREALQRLRLASNASAIGIWNWNIADESLEWDDRLCELYAVPMSVRERGITYDFWRSRVHPDDLEQAEVKLAEARRTGVENDSIFRIVLPNGQIRDIQSASVVEYDHKGEPRRMIGINRDVTDQKTAERVLQESNADLEQHVAVRTAQLAAALEELKKAAQLKDEFMAAVSHELRTPLTGVLGMADALEIQNSGTLNERQLRYVQSIRQSGNRLLSMVNSILRYAGLLGGQVNLQQESCQLDDLCAIALHSVRAHAEQKALMVELSIEPAGLTVISDGDGIIQMLQQLLDNAVKFTPAGGRIGLQVRNATGQDAVELVVWDTGIGITDEIRAIIFRPFVQGDAALSRRYEGVGLGLAYVQRMVELLGGTISLESAPGAGSRFTVTLPVRSAPPEPRA